MRKPALGTIRTEGAALLQWWMRELRDIAQQLLERIAPRFAKQVVVEFKGSTAEAYVLLRSSSSERVTICRDRSGSWPNPFPTGDATGDYRGARATLVLAPADTLTLELLLPNALRGDLGKIIALQLERELPLAPDQFAMDYQIHKHLLNTERIRIQVCIAHRTQVDQLRDLAQEWGFRPTRIRGSDETGRIIGDFLRSPFRFRRLQLTPIERRLSAAVFTLAIALAVLIAGQWTYERIVVDAALRRVGAQAQVASRLTAQLHRALAPARDLLRISSIPDASDVLASLTQAVPPYAWVYRLHVQAPSTGAISIRMGAFAPPATALASILQDSHHFGTVQLNSATSIGAPSGLDRIKLTASRAASTLPTSSTDDTGIAGDAP